EGPNTPESIEGSQEDQAHDATTGEGTPADEQADAGLAAQLNASGQMPTPPEGIAPGGAAPSEIGAAPGTMTKTINVPVNVPITVSIKLGEIDHVRAERAKAFKEAQLVMAEMF